MSWEDKQQRLTVWLPKALHKWLKKRTKEQNIPMSKLIRRIIVELMMKERKEKE